MSERMVSSAREELAVLAVLAHPRFAWGPRNGLSCPPFRFYSFNHPSPYHGEADAEDVAAAEEQAAGRLLGDGISRLHRVLDYSGQDGQREEAHNAEAHEE